MKYVNQVRQVSLIFTWRGKDLTSLATSNGENFTMNNTKEYENLLYEHKDLIRDVNELREYSASITDVEELSYITGSLCDLLEGIRDSISLFLERVQS